MKYVSKRTEIDAIRFDGENVEDIAHFLGSQVPTIEDGYLMLQLQGGEIGVAKGHYIVRDCAGTIGYCRADPFQECYEPVEEQTAEAVPNSGALKIMQERTRQMEREGFTADHDKGHAPGVMAQAAGCYIGDALLEAQLTAEQREKTHITRGLAPMGWPWADEWWKPTPGDPIRQLVKAGALIAAEIDRLLEEKKMGELVQEATDTLDGQPLVNNKDLKECGDEA